MTTSRVPALSEAEFQRQVTDLATLCGWLWYHARPAQTSKGWRTPVQGSLGKGFPDLILVRPRDHRLIFAELKTDSGKVTPAQEDVLTVLSYLRTYDADSDPKVEVHVWRPKDFDRITEALR